MDAVAELRVATGSRDAIDGAVGPTSSLHMYLRRSRHAARLFSANIMGRARPLHLRIHGPRTAEMHWKQKPGTLLIGEHYNAPRPWEVRR